MPNEQLTPKPEDMTFDQLLIFIENGVTFDNIEVEGAKDGAILYRSLTEPGLHFSILFDNDTDEEISIDVIRVTRTITKS